MRQSVVIRQRHLFWYRWTTVCLKDMILELVHVYFMLDPGNCIVARNLGSVSWITLLCTCMCCMRRVVSAEENNNVDEVTNQAR